MVDKTVVPSEASSGVQKALSWDVLLVSLMEKRKELQCTDEGNKKRERRINQIRLLLHLTKASTHQFNDPYLAMVSWIE